jgi:hypothetical protein
MNSTESIVILDPLSCFPQGGKDGFTFPLGGRLGWGFKSIKN